jgi:hypothetical protein
MVTQLADMQKRERVPQEGITGRLELVEHLTGRRPAALVA